MSNNNTKDRINVRYNSLSIHKISSRNKHDFRNYNSHRDNINNDLSNTNIFMFDKENEKLRIREYKERYEHFYKKNNDNRKPNYNRVSPFIDMVLTFPHKYQETITDKKLWRECLAEFIKEFQEQTGVKVINCIEHNDETTRHYHFKTTSYTIQDKKLISGTLFKAGMKSKLQDIAGKAYEKLGLRRGNKKSTTNSTHKTPREYYEKQVENMENQNNELSKALEDNHLSNEELDTLIEISENPYKKLYRQVKRIKGHKEEAEDTIKATNKTIQGILKAFPLLSKHLEDNDDLKPLEVLELLASKLSKSKIVEETEKQVISDIKSDR